jgi:hypothetical protein
LDFFSFLLHVDNTSVCPPLPAHNQPKPEHLLTIFAGESFL